MTILFVIGTGTNVGKTHLSCALLTHFRETHRVMGFKPVETGVSNGVETDQDRLDVATRKKNLLSRYVYNTPLSVSVVSRESPVDIASIAESVRGAQDAFDLLVVESAGGLFSPLSAAETNADLGLSLQALGATTLLVAENRLGVLHDVGATLRAAACVHLHVAGLVMMAPRVPDLSTPLNMNEFVRTCPSPILPSYRFECPRGSVDALAKLDALDAVHSLTDARRPARES